MTTSTSESDDLLKNIFNINDVNQDGCITIQSFLTIIKENWPMNLDENKLDNLVELLDPNGIGKIDYEQFLYAISKMSQLDSNVIDSTTTTTTTKNNNNKKKKLINNDYNYDRHSNGSNLSNDTFNEYETDSENNYKNNDCYESIEKNNRKNKYLNSNTVDESYEDYGTLDANNTNITDALSSTSSLHSNSLFVDLTDSSNSTNLLLASPLKSNLKSSKKRANESYRNSSHQFNNNNNDNYFDQNSSGGEFSSSSGNNRIDEGIINELEEKVRSLENKIDELKADKLDYIDRYSKLQVENSSLNEKLHEIEELNHEYERSFKSTIESEKQRYSDYIAKLNSKHSDEKDALLAQLNKNESEIVNYKADISRYTRQINELNKSVELKTLHEYQLDEKLNNLKQDYQRIVKEKDLYKEDLETMKTKNNQRVEALTKELTDLRNLQQNSKRRAQTIFQTDETKVKELELELQQSKNECKHLQLTIEELEARILRNSLDAGKLLMAQANVPSLAAEMEVMSKDELMDKLNNEQKACNRYRDYIDRILSAIMERNPEILEIRTSTIASGGGSAKISNNKAAVSFSAKY